MKIFQRFKKKNDVTEEQGSPVTNAAQEVEANHAEADHIEGEHAANNEDEQVTTGTKIKVIGALALVGFASYVAYWVQEPSNVTVNLFDATEQEELLAEAQNTDEVMADESVTQDQAATNSNTNTDTEASSSQKDHIENIIASATARTSAEDASVVLAAEEDDAAATAESTIMTAQALPSTQEISIIDFTFTPANLTIDAGTTVKWTNNDAVAHTITSDFFGSGTLNPGESFEYTFEDAGAIDYFCSLHPQMTGKVTVLASAVPVNSSSANAANTSSTSSNSSAAGSHFSDPSTAETTAANATNDELRNAAGDSLLGDNAITLDAQEFMNDETNAADSSNAANNAGVQGIPQPTLLTVPGTTSTAVAVNAESGSAPTANLQGNLTGPNELSNSGPAETAYFLLFAAILYFTRKRHQQSL